MADLAYSLLPIAEVYDWMRKTIPALMPAPPPPAEDDRYTDRIEEGELRQITMLAKALGMKYVELDRYLKVWTILDNVRTGTLTIRQVSMQWRFRHSPFADMVFSHSSQTNAAASYGDIADDSEDSDSDDDDGGDDDDDDSSVAGGAPATARSDRSSSTASSSADSSSYASTTSSDVANAATAAVPRTVNMVQMFTNLFEFCTLSESEVLMFLLHCANVHEPEDLPTPNVIVTRLVRLAWGPKPSTEIVQLLRCLRCLPEAAFLSVSAPPSVPAASAAAAVAAATAESAANDDDHHGGSSSSGRNGEGVGGRRDNTTLPPSQPPPPPPPPPGAAASGGQREKQRLRPVLHNDSSMPLSQRWQSLCLLLLRFPILVQPALCLQKSLARKSMGNAFWQRMAFIRRTLPLGHRRIGFPRLTPKRLLATAEQIGFEAEGARDIRYGRFADTVFQSAPPDVVWEMRRIKFSDAAKAKQDKEETARKKQESEQWFKDRSGGNSQRFQSQRYHDGGHENEVAQQSGLMALSHYSDGSNSDGVKNVTILMLEEEEGEEDGGAANAGVGGKQTPKERKEKFKFNLKKASKSKAKGTETKGRHQNERSAPPKEEVSAAAMMVGRWRGVAPGSNPSICKRWMLGAGYERWCGLPKPKKAIREPRWRVDSSDSDADPFSDDSQSSDDDSTSEEEDEKEEEGGDGAPGGETDYDDQNNMGKEGENETEETEEKKDNSESSEKNYTSGGAPGVTFNDEGKGYDGDDDNEKSGGGKDNLNDDEDAGISTENEEEPLLYLWPPVGLVAEALIGPPTSTPNHAWFVTATFLAVLAVDSAPSLNYRHEDRKNEYGEHGHNNKHGASVRNSTPLKQKKNDRHSSANSARHARNRGGGGGVRESVPIHSSRLGDEGNEGNGDNHNAKKSKLLPSTSYVEVQEKQPKALRKDHLDSGVTEKELKENDEVGRGQFSRFMSRVSKSNSNSSSNRSAVSSSSSSSSGSGSSRSSRNSSGSSISSSEPSSSGSSSQSNTPLSSNAGSRVQSAVPSRRASSRGIYTFPPAPTPAGAPVDDGPAEGKSVSVGNRDLEHRNAAAALDSITGLSGDSDRRNDEDTGAIIVLPASVGDDACQQPPTTYGQQTSDNWQEQQQQKEPHQKKSKAETARQSYAQGQQELQQLEEQILLEEKKEQQVLRQQRQADAEEKERLRQGRAERMDAIEKKKREQKKAHATSARQSFAQGNQDRRKIEEQLKLEEEKLKLEEKEEERMRSEQRLKEKKEQERLKRDRDAQVLAVREKSRESQREHSVMARQRYGEGRRELRENEEKERRQQEEQRKEEKQEARRRSTLLAKERGEEKLSQKLLQKQQLKVEVEQKQLEDKTRLQQKREQQREVEFAARLALKEPKKKQAKEEEEEEVGGDNDNTDEGKEEGKRSVPAELERERKLLLEWFVGPQARASSELAEALYMDDNECDEFSWRQRRQSNNLPRPSSSYDEKEGGRQPLLNRGPPYGDKEGSGGGENDGSESSGVATLSEWYSSALALTSPEANAMLGGTWTTAKFRLVGRTHGRTGGSGGGLSEEVTFDEGDPRARTDREYKAGALPGAAAPQPFHCLLLAPLAPTRPASGLESSSRAGTALSASSAAGSRGETPLEFMFSGRGKTLATTMAAQQLGPRAILLDGACVARLELLLNRLTTTTSAFGQFVLSAACVRKDERLAESLSLAFGEKVEPLDEKFWVELKAEAGPHRGESFFVNIRTGVRTWKKPTFARLREKSRAAPYIRIW